MHAGLACHCSPHPDRRPGGSIPLDLEPSVEARSWCDLHCWLMTGRPCFLPMTGPRGSRAPAGRATPAATA
ncbi:hypothetical protein Ae331Ps2_3833c [Pseudonocardia sp. Ae331_Ps2]|nr:hypothetical protein Ae331Ps2_3833c [Pseudonocardia sp. Ae331_Ps2]